MYQKGFTLIELLVVVLIIGILAAVALPQYQKAVMKSRLAAAIPIAKSVYNNLNMYYLAEGAWPKTDATGAYYDLDSMLDYPEKSCQSNKEVCQVGNYGVWMRSGYGVFVVYCPGESRGGYCSSAVNGIGWYANNPSYPPNQMKMVCLAGVGNAQANAVCKGYGPLISNAPISTPLGSTYMAYSMQ